MLLIQHDQKVGFKSEERKWVQLQIAREYYSLAVPFFFRICLCLLYILTIVVFQMSC